jgi:uncharacterized protein YdeI (YjbR/CyaY-like superfamily)
MEPDQNRIKPFESATCFHTWLRANHDSESELWLKIFKRASGKKSINWEGAVIEALCWGWIDGIRKSLDDQTYLQRFTPRRKGSNWSKRNREHVEKLLEEGRMEDAGLFHVKAAKSDGRWENAYVSSEMKIPDDFISSVTSIPKALIIFEALNKSQRYIIALGLATAKKPETRLRRFNKYLEQLSRGEKPR